MKQSNSKFFRKVNGEERRYDTVQRSIVSYMVGTRHLKLITGVSYLLTLFSSMPASVSPPADSPGDSDLHETIFKDNRKKFWALKIPSKIGESTALLGHTLIPE